jgi:hypothetical protein
MKSIEESVLLAILDGEEEDAQKLIAQLLPGERQNLAKAASRLADLCKSK